MNMTKDEGIRLINLLLDYIASQPPSMRYAAFRANFEITNNLRQLRDEMQEVEVIDDSE